ncbi:hypothetical protein D3C71_2038160 [compost metagenome]
MLFLRKITVTLNDHFPQPVNQKQRKTPAGVGCDCLQTLAALLGQPFGQKQMKIAFDLLFGQRHMHLAQFGC